MNNNLEDIGLSALEELAQDDVDTAEENTQDAEDTAEDTTADSAEDSGDTTETSEEKGTEPEEDASDADDNTDDDATEDTAEPEQKEEKHELTDEEFEELAKKRGYSKHEDKEETTTEENPKTQDLLAKPEEIDKETWENMDDEMKIVYNQLPYIQAKGDDGKIYKIKTQEQLPANFRFSDDNERMRFMADLTAQEKRAEDSINKIEEFKQREAYAREAREIVDGVAAMQKAGELPIPKLDSNDPKFNDDPAVKVINHVLNFKKEKETQGYKLSIEDATLLYKAKHPDEFRKDAKGDQERASIAKKVSGSAKNSGKPVNNVDKSPKDIYGGYRPGMSIQDIVDEELSADDITY